MESLLKTCLLGWGTVINDRCITLRPLWNGYRIYIDHQSCPILPYGGYVSNLVEADKMLQRFRSLVLGYQRHTKDF